MTNFSMKIYCALRGGDKSDKIESPLQSTIVLSIAFFFVFSAFMSIQALQNSLNMEAGLGVKSLACLYSASIVSSLLAPFCIKVLGGKITVVAAFSCHSVYVMSNYYPRFYTLIPTSVLLGLATGPLWTAQNLFITASATRIAVKSNKNLKDVLNRHNGIFFSIQGMAFAIGSVVSSLIFHTDTTLASGNVTKYCGTLECDSYTQPITSNISFISVTRPSPQLLHQLFSVYLAFDIIGVVIAVLLLPTLPVSEWIKKKSALKSVYSMCSSLSNVKLVLFLPLTVMVNVQRFVLYADFTKAYITCPFSIGWVGLVMASYALTNTIMLQILQGIAKLIKRQILVAFAAIVNLAEMTFWLFWNPTADHLPLVFVSVILWGVTDAIWKLEIFGIIPVLFSTKKEPAFANVHFWGAFSSAIYFGTASYLCVFTKLVICIALMIISMLLYIVLQIKLAREQSPDRPTEQEINIEEKEKLKNQETSADG
ncbi:protein unc-93 homolog A-like [Mytilus californianus]|uniref:protein unc-93 homolog A-like n=1 Tax=Mytilus californianus TaxID=6549 RepID=UPI00224826C9|nr:protein unc-93 homolog A-like [Mytilus californianus]